MLWGWLQVQLSYNDLELVEQWPLPVANIVICAVCAALLLAGTFMELRYLCNWSLMQRW
jgi:hypothetical protein